MANTVKLTGESNLVVELDCPKRFIEKNPQATSTKIKIKKKYGEFVYFPKRGSFWRTTFLSVEELPQIIDKLNELNNQDL